MSDHVVESTFELSAFMKGGIMAGSERDSVSCSGADEDSRSGLHSPTASEDSVDVQVTPISLRNKRKLAEPRKIQEPAVIATPLKKRRIISEETTVDQEEARSRTPNHFRPWIPVSSKNECKTTTTTSTVTAATAATVSSTITTTSTTSSTKSSSVSERAEEEKEVEEQNEAMQRLQESVRRIQQSSNHNRSAFPSRREPRHKSSFEPAAPTATASTPNMISLPHPRLQDEPLSLVVRDEVPRVPSHPAVSGTYEKTPSYMMEHLLASSSSRNHQSHRSHQGHPTAIPASSGRHHHHQNGQGGQQRNYKNMTRERRIEANARERTRVHTISAAFDTLRRAIPAYSHNQKLSKLSVLRIACSYIMTLSKILEKDDEMATTRNNGLAGLGSCVELVSRTIQTEGKLRKRKDE